jgi:hypothetical protein
MHSRLGVTATTDMAVLPGVLGCWLLQRTIQVRLGNQSRVTAGRLPGGTPIFMVSRQQFMKHPGYGRSLASVPDCLWVSELP